MQMAGTRSNGPLDSGNTIIHTIGMKIAISMPDNIFMAVKRAAEEQKRSRSEVIVEAVRAYLERLESCRMLQTLNDAYAAPETQEEINARGTGLDLYARTVRGKEEW